MLPEEVQEEKEPNEVIMENQVTQYVLPIDIEEVETDSNKPYAILGGEVPIKEMTTEEERMTTNNETEHTLQVDHLRLLAIETHSNITDQADAVELEDLAEDIQIKPEVTESSNQQYAYPKQTHEESMNSEQYYNETDQYEGTIPTEENQM